MKTKYFETADNWERWLAENHDSETELWLIYYKKHTKKISIPYDDSVKVALCYGWVDSLIKKLDEDCYARKFSLRKDSSFWSESNKKRIAELIEAGKMQKAGLVKVEAAKQNGNWDKVINPPEIETAISKEFKNALDENTTAKTLFNSLSKAQQKQFIIWINVAKQTETKQKRIEQSVLMLSRGQKLGLK